MNESANPLSEEALRHTTEYTRSVLSTAAGWIASADQKAASILSVNGAALALVFAFSNETEHIWARCMVLAFGLFAVISVVLCAVTVFPSTNRPRILAHAKAERPRALSATFFADIVKMSFPAFVSSAATTLPAALLQDAQEQAYVVAAIATRKMKLMKWAIAAAIVAYIALGGAIWVANLRADTGVPRNAVTRVTGGASEGTGAITTGDSRPVAGDSSSSAGVGGGANGAAAQAQAAGAAKSEKGTGVTSAGTETRK